MNNGNNYAIAGLNLDQTNRILRDGKSNLNLVENFKISNLIHVPIPFNKFLKLEAVILPFENELISDLLIRRSKSL